MESDLAVDIPSKLAMTRDYEKGLNKGEYNLNQSKDGSFVERVAKNNS